MNDKINYLKYHNLLNSYKRISSQYQNLSMKYSFLVKNQEVIINKKINEVTTLLKKEHSLILKEYDQKFDEKDKQIEALKKEVAKLHSILNNDSNNSGIPTSQTPYKKNKRIPNTREKTDKNPGGQKGRKKHSLKAFPEEEATEIKNIIPKECPYCGSFNIVELDTSINKCVTDYIVKVEKIIYKFKDCSCSNCHKQFHEKIPYNIKEENQYGNTVQALALCLTNEIYTPFNKTVKLIKGITNGEINPSEGYIVKLQAKYGKKLDDFIVQLKAYFPKQEVFGWDDSVITINAKNATLRVYCTDKVSLFFAHEKKNKEGIDNDGILSATTSNTIVMHDHLLINYNDEYSFQNVECLIHLIRRLKKMEENTKHSWLKNLKELLSTTNIDRNQLIKDDKQSFNKEYLDNLYKCYDDIIEKAFLENENDRDNYFTKEEVNFIKDLKKYRNNYLLWAQKFNIPSTNNSSERNIRPIKSKMKISGQFKNIDFAKYHANLRSYIETCKKSDINIIEACVRLARGEPFTLEEILNYNKKD